MENYTIISSSPENTMNIAKKIANLLQKRDIVVLTGELGAGKTKFVEGFLSYFNLQDEISSPTFNIVNEYHSEKAEIYHFDVYRLEDSDEFYAIGGEEYFDKGICLIEWGETLKSVIPKDYLQIKFTKDSSSEDKRILEFIASGEHSKLLIKKLKEDLN